MKGKTINKVELLNLYRSGDYSQKELADMFSISPQHFQYILNYEMLPKEREQIKKLIKTKRQIKKFKASL